MSMSLKYIGLVLKDKFKPLKLIYLTNNTCTSTIFKFSNPFSTKLSKKNDENKCINITHQCSFFLPLEFVLNEFNNLKFLYVHASLVEHISFNSLDSLFETNTVDLELYSPNLF